MNIQIHHVTVVNKYLLMIRYSGDANIEAIRWLVNLPGFSLDFDEINNERLVDILFNNFISSFREPFRCTLVNREEEIFIISYLG